MASQLMLFETETTPRADGTFLLKPRRLVDGKEISAAKAAGLLGFKDVETIHGLIKTRQILGWKPESKRGNGKYRIDLGISDGTARDGLFTTTNGVDFVSVLDADWTIVVAADGSSEYRYNGVAMAIRATGLNDDACGIYASTELGKRLNPATPEDDPEPLEYDEDAVNPFGLLTLTYNWSGAPDLDIGVSFLDLTAGFGHSSPSTGGPVGPYMTWTGDNTTTGGPETVVIDLAAAWDTGDISTFADVLAEADWYPTTGGSGPASLTVTYDLPGAAGTPVTHLLHPGQLTPATTDALSLRILAAGSVAATGDDWTVTVRAIRRVPVAGVVSLAITETAGAVTAVADPVFSATLPADVGDVIHYTLATSDGSGGVRQSHSGPLVWESDPLPPLTKTERDALASPATRMMIYQTTDTPGLRVYNGTNWMRFTETAD